MELRGVRIHIAGSASHDTPTATLLYAHNLVSQLVGDLANLGASFVVSFGHEPLLKDVDGNPSIIFDWTVAEAINRALAGGQAKASGPNGRLIFALGTSKTHNQIPEGRRPLYEELHAADAISMEFVAPGWSGGAHRRERLARVGDIFIGISGGEGVEHLALAYSARSKPAIPLDIQLGASHGDGAGGAGRLFEKALHSPTNFFRVSKEHSAAALLEQTRCRNGESKVNDVVAGILKLMRALCAPKAFYVRLLDTSSAEYPAVEAFFRSVVDPLIVEMGYEIVQMGLSANEHVWMNQAIFESIHGSSLVFADLTGLRPNCFMELGFALGMGQRVITSAQEGIRLPFDSAAIDTFLWNPSADPSVTLTNLRTHWARNIGRPSLVQPREAL